MPSASASHRGLILGMSRLRTVKGGSVRANLEAWWSGASSSMRVGEVSGKLLLLLRRREKNVVEDQAVAGRGRELAQICRGIADGMARVLGIVPSEKRERALAVIAVHVLGEPPAAAGREHDDARLERVRPVRCRKAVPIREPEVVVLGEHRGYGIDRGREALDEDLVEGKPLGRIDPMPVDRRERPRVAGVDREIA